MDKLNTLSLGEKLVAGGGIAMFIFSFLPWHHISVSAGPFSTSINRSAWQSPDAIWSMLAVLVSIALVVVVLGPKFANMKLPDLGSVTWGQAVFGASVAVAVLVVLKFISTTGYLGFGFFLGILAAAAIAAGGYLLYTEEKTGVSH